MNNGFFIYGCYVLVSSTYGLKDLDPWKQERILPNWSTCDAHTHTHTHTHTLTTAGDGQHTRYSPSKGFHKLCQITDPYKCTQNKRKHTCVNNMWLDLKVLISTEYLSGKVGSYSSFLSSCQVTTFATQHKHIVQHTHLWVANVDQPLHSHIKCKYLILWRLIRCNENKYSSNV